MEQIEAPLVPAGRVSVPGTGETISALIPFDETYRACPPDMNDMSTCFREGSPALRGECMSIETSHVALYAEPTRKITAGHALVVAVKPVGASEPAILSSADPRAGTRETVRLELDERSPARHSR